MQIVISNANDQPLYQQIGDQIRRAIFRGELKPGDPLPSIRGMASDLGVSVLTVRRVYDDLENQGFLQSRAGRGTFVAAGNLELLREGKRREVEEKLAAVVDQARACGITRLELAEMLDIFYGEEDPGAAGIH